MFPLETRTVVLTQVLNLTLHLLSDGLNMVAVFTCANNFGFFRLTVNISLWLTKILKINYLGFKDKFKINLLIYDL